MQLSGELSKVNFANLLQLVRSGGLSGRITLLQGARQAQIYIQEGYPVHVEAEGITGKDALFELFLWDSGTFAFSEGEIGAVPRSTGFDSQGEGFDRMLREGLLYAQDKNYLTELGITARSVLRLSRSGQEELEAGSHLVGVDKLDGVRTLADALAPLGLSRREFVHTVAYWLSSGIVESAPTGSRGANHVELPDWVVARLKQDNDDMSRAIVDMVIWVDRVKCWMYQADADLDRIMGTLRSEADLSDFRDMVERQEQMEQRESMFGGPAQPPD
jgi:hypothetical protein